MRLAAHEADVEDEAVRLDTEHELIRSAMRTHRAETVGLQKIVERHFAFMLDFAGAADGVALLQLHFGQPEGRRLSHRRNAR